MSIKYWFPGLHRDNSFQIKELVLLFEVSSEEKANNLLRSVEFYIIEKDHIKEAKIAAADLIKEISMIQKQHQEHLKSGWITRPRLEDFIRMKKEVMIRSRPYTDKRTDNILWGIPIHELRDPERIENVRRWQEDNGLNKLWYLKEQKDTITISSDEEDEGIFLRPNRGNPNIVGTPIQNEIKGAPIINFGDNSKISQNLKNLIKFSGSVKKDQQYPNYPAMRPTKIAKKKGLKQKAIRLREKIEITEIRLKELKQKEWDLVEKIAMKEEKKDL